MVKKVVKMLIITIITIIIANISAIYNNKSYADGEDKSGPMGDITENLNEWNPGATINADDYYATGEYSKFDNAVEAIAGMIGVIGTVISVGSLAVIGIKFLLGSVEEKAQYKQTLVPWLIGAVMVFGMTNLPNIIFKMARGTFN